MERFKSLLKQIDIVAIILGVYAGFVLGEYLYVNSICTSKNCVLIAILFAVICYLVFNPLHKKINGLEGFRYKTYDKKEKIIVFAVSSLIILAAMMFWFVVYFPGSYSYDSFDQITQAMENSYSDWHPVLHTLLYFTLPLKITKSISVIVLLQIIYFSLAAGYMALTIAELVNKWAAAITVGFIILNPYFGNILLFPWKDVAFATAGVLCTTMVIRLIYNKEKLNKTWFLILLGIVIALATLFRHNALFYTIPLLLFLIINTEKKVWIKVTAVTLISVFLVRVPLYAALHVEKPGDRVTESMGLPLTVIANVAKETPELMDEELSEFAYALGTPEIYDNYYTGDFNSIKWGGVDTSVVEETGYVGMLKLMFKCFKLSPDASAKALLSLTDVVYGTENSWENSISPEIHENSYGVAYPGGEPKSAAALLSSYSDMVNSTIFRYLKTYGVILFALLFIALCRLKAREKASWKKLILLLPIFAYDFGTMLLLTGTDSRFFFITFAVAPLLIAESLSGQKKEV